MGGIHARGRENRAKVHDGAFAIAVLIVPVAQADRASRTHSSPAQENSVSKWSLISQNAISAPIPPAITLRPPASSEVLHGLVHAAIYDAVVAVEGEYESLAISVRAPKRTSVDAAVAAAARGVLVARVPTQAAAVEAAYSAALLEIPDGDSKTNGIRVGRAIGGAYVSLRSDDGFGTAPPWVQPPRGRHLFRQFPRKHPGDTELANIRPLTFDDPARFRPPGLFADNAAYAAMS